MSNLSRYTGIGRIADITFEDTIPGKPGLQMCKILVPVTIWKPTRDGEGSEDTIWTEVIAWSSEEDRSRGRFNMAEHWNKRFAKKQVVHVSGQPRLRPYVHNGEARVTMTLDRPEIDLVLGQQQHKPEDEETLSDPPF